MNIYKHKTLWKSGLLTFAVIIGLFSLLYTNNLVRQLKAEERKKVEIWAEATRQMIFTTDTSSQNLDFLYTIIVSNTTIPVILTDGYDSIISSNNFDSTRINDAVYLKTRLKKIKEKNEPIIAEFGGGIVNRIYYDDSIILKQLIYYPYVQLGIIILFIVVSYFAFSASRKAEQNQVWVGMSKETAHQLGTPTSSLAGWIEVLQLKYPELDVSAEMALDISRLEKITERFSKIGSRPDLNNEDIKEIVKLSVDYLRSRASSKTVFKTEFPTGKKILVPVNASLLSWVIENVCKNAVDATEGAGEIAVKVSDSGDNAIIDICDNGKGIPKSAHRKIFSPGYTTKARGWGLGLSLARRIIEEYHNGKIFVRYSEPGIGTCIRIMVKKVKVK